MSEKFKISGVGIDTSRINQRIPENALDDFTYVHTSINSGNEYIIKEAINPEATLITTIDFLDKSDIVIESYLRELGRDYIDLLLIDSKCRVEDYSDLLENLIISGVVKEIGISNPSSLKDLEYMSKSFSEISAISLDICPLNFPWSIINYCKNKDIKILGFNQFGGKINATRLIESFSVPYLLSFSAAYSDIVFLSGQKLNTIDDEISYLIELIDKEYDKEFSINQDINKLLKKPKRTVNTSLVISEDLEIPYNSRETIFSFSELKFGIGDKKIIKLPEEDRENFDDLEKLVYEYYDNFSGGPIDNNTPENTLAILRPRILDLSRIQYLGEEGWGVFCTKISEQAFVISSVRKSEEKRFLRKAIERFEQNSYILYFDGTNFLFRKLKNAILEE